MCKSQKSDFVLRTPHEPLHGDRSRLYVLQGPFLWQNQVEFNTVICYESHFVVLRPNEAQYNRILFTSLLVLRFDIGSVKVHEFHRGCSSLDRKDALVQRELDWNYGTVVFHSEIYGTIGFSGTFDNDAHDTPWTHRKHLEMRFNLNYISLFIQFNLTINKSHANLHNENQNQQESYKKAYLFQFIYRLIVSSHRGTIFTTTNLPDIVFNPNSVQRNSDK